MEMSKKQLEEKILSFREKFMVHPWKNHPLLSMIDEHFGIENGKFKEDKEDNPYHIDYKRQTKLEF